MSKKTLNPALAAVAGLGAALILTGCSVALAGTPTEPPTFSVTGTLDLQDSTSDDLATPNFLYGSGVASDDKHCAGTGGYDDITGGNDVTVYAANGDLVATGQLNEGKVMDSYYTCEFTWKVTGVPTNKGPYQYEISHRGKLGFTESRGMTEDLASTLGGN